MNQFNSNQSPIKRNDDQWFDNKMSKQQVQRRRLADAPSEELIKAISDREFTLSEYRSLTRDEKELLKDEIKQIVFTISRMKKILNDRGLCVNNDTQTQLDNLKQKHSNLIKLRSEEIANMKDKFESKIAFQEIKINELIEKNKSLGRTIINTNKKHKLKIQSMNEVKQKELATHKYFKELIKNQYGMTVFLELIEEASKRADSENS